MIGGSPSANDLQQWLVAYDDLSRYERDRVTYWALMTVLVASVVWSHLQAKRRNEQLGKMITRQNGILDNQYQLNAVVRDIREEVED